MVRTSRLLQYLRRHHLATLMSASRLPAASPLPGESEAHPSPPPGKHREGGRTSPELLKAPPVCTRRRAEPRRLPCRYPAAGRNLFPGLQSLQRLEAKSVEPTAPTAPSPEEGHHRADGPPRQRPTEPEGDDGGEAAADRREEKIAPQLFLHVGEARCRIGAWVGGKDLARSRGQGLGLFGR